MTSERGTLRLERGDWEEAERDLRWVLDQPEEPGIPQMPALATLARLAVRRGDETAPDTLREAWALAEPTGELQRIAPVAAARAESAWLDDDPGACRAAVEWSYQAARDVGQPWVADELAFWMWRAGVDDVEPHDLATPFALQISGRWEEAAEAWSNLGCPYEEATALIDSGDRGPLLKALGILDELGAGPASNLVRAKLRKLGVHSVPRGPRPATKAHPAGLTPRQVEVLALLVEGLTNSEIADRLFVSSKTVDHHVSAVLAKLGVGSRREAARAAIERDLIPTEPS